MESHPSEAVSPLPPHPGPPVGTAAPAAGAAERPLADEYDLSEQLAAMLPAMLFEGSTPAELSSWQARFRATLVRLLWDPPERGALDLRWERADERGAYTRHYVTYQSEPGLRIPAWLLMPRGIS